MTNIYHNKQLKFLPSNIDNDQQFKSLVKHIFHIVRTQLKIIRSDLASNYSYDEFIKAYEC